MASDRQVDQGIERMGRVAIATQGALYVGVGLLAAQVARGDRDAEPSQRGALENVAQQPFGQALLVVLAVGLVSYAAWRAVLAVRGDPGDDDSTSLAKRAANAGRAVIYLCAMDRRQRRTVELLGSAGYLARGVSFVLVGWFLVTAGVQHDPAETRGLDDALRELATTEHGPALLTVLAVGLAVFGVFRVIDAMIRRPAELTTA